MKDDIGSTQLKSVVSGWSAVQRSMGGQWSVDSRAPAQHDVAADAQNDKERAHDDQVHVELGVLNVEFFDHVRWLLKYALLHLLVYVLRLRLTVERIAVVAVDRLNHAFKCIPTNTRSHRRRFKTANITISSANSKHKR